MAIPLKRVFDEKRRLVIPILAALALNIALYALVVYPLGARVRSCRLMGRSLRHHNNPFLQWQLICPVLSNFQQLLVHPFHRQ